MASMPINNGNKGCVALSITAMFLIDELLKGKGIEYEFYLTDSNCEENSLQQCQILDKIIEFRTSGYPLCLSKRDCFRMLMNPLTLKRDIDVFRKSDYIFDIGQGDSFSDIYGKRRFKLIDRVHKVARFFRKPYCLLPQTIGPFENDLIKKQAIKSIGKSNLVMARDKQSLDYVKNNVSQQANIQEFLDVAFFMPYKKKTFSNEFIHVGLNISSLLWHGGYTKNNQFGLSVDYPQLIRDTIHYFLSIPNIKLHLIPHVVSNDYHVENDYAVSYDLIEEYNHDNLILSPLFLTPIQAKNYIAGMDFFAGARMHATIAAFSSEVPVYPMAYSRKFNGLFEDTLAYSYMGDMKAQTNDEILTEIKDAFEKRDELKTIIQNRMNGVVAERKKLLEKYLVEFLDLK